MYYRGRGPWRGYRRRGGLFGIPWMLFFVFMFFAHSPGAWLIGLLLVVVITIVLTRVFSGNSFNGMNGQQPGQTYYQPGTQSDQQPYYQPPTAQPYQPYGQGYQPPVQSQEGYKGSASQYQPPVQNDPYQGEYEQPQTQYPEQMPPMQ
jgi:hypothetical protein